MVTIAKGRTHEHKWSLHMHLDSCHAWSSTYTCRCGAVRHVTAERNVKDDPYSMVWMEQHDEDQCERCEALLAGAEPTTSDEITEKPA